MAIEHAHIVESDPSADLPSRPRPPEPAPRLFTVDEYYKMAEVGILRPDERVQLIEGTIFEMPAIGPRHAYNVNRLAMFFALRLGGRAMIRNQIPIHLATRAEPEPDVAVVRTYPDNPKLYETRHPSAEETYFVVEVADSTLTFDLGAKALMYALHGIRDLWVIDLQDDAVVVHREPTADGYASVVTMHRGDTVSPLDFPGLTFTVDELLG
ncbi:MAG: Uma2 family endonuclease [Chloroflexota bacterium]